MSAVQKFRLSGIGVYNQLVFTYYNSRRFEAAALRQKLRLIGVSPYYTFNTKGKKRPTVIVCLLPASCRSSRRRRGCCRARCVPMKLSSMFQDWGKNYLRAAQNRDIIAILPNGRRVYEFHPWEKKTCPG